MLTPKFLFLCPILLLGSSTFAALPYTVTVNDPANSFGNQKDAVLANLDAAIQDWARFIQSKGQLWIEIDVTDNTPTGRFSGGSTGARAVGSENGYDIFEQSGTYKLRTGQSVNPAVADVVIQASPTFMNAYYWIDPNPQKRTDPVPAGKTDLVTVFAHELGHAFGIQGWLDLQTGTPTSYHILSVYDTFVLMKSPLAPVFTGAHSVSINGSQPPLTLFQAIQSDVNISHGGSTYGANLNPSQNIYHVGRFSTVADEDTDLSFYSLMAGAWESPSASSTVGWRIRVNPLDAAIIEDLGVPAAQ